MSDGFMPGVIVKSIPPGVNDPRITPVGVIAHVAVYEGDSLYHIFKNRGGIESHFYVRYDGKIEQYRSIWWEADAQTEGNSFIYDGRRSGFISVETEGKGTGKWTPSQIASIKRIMEYVNSQSPFAKRVCPGWNQPGIGYHSMFDQWNPLHKSCPGAERKVQFNEVIAPWWRNYGKVQPVTVVGAYKKTTLTSTRKALREVNKTRTKAIKIMKEIEELALQLPDS